MHDETRGKEMIPFCADISPRFYPFVVLLYACADTYTRWDFGASLSISDWPGDTVTRVLTLALTFAHSLLYHHRLQQHISDIFYDYLSSGILFSPDASHWWPSRFLQYLDSTAGERQFRFEQWILTSRRPSKQAIT